MISKRLGTQITSVALALTSILSATLMANEPLDPVEQVETVDTSKTLRIPIKAELKRHLLAVKRFIAEQNFKKANTHLTRAKALGIELPPEYYYFNAKALMHNRELEQAKTNFEEYILRADEDSEHYISALEMITQVETLQPSASIAESAKPQIVWESSNQPDQTASYIERVAPLYAEHSAQAAMVAHINTLLSKTPFMGNRQGNTNPEPPTIDLKITISGDRNIVVQKTQKREGENQIISFSTSAFGLSREFSSLCDQNQLKCTIKHKETLNTWFEIGNDEAVAQELVQAMAALIVLLQSSPTPSPASP